MSNLGTEFSFKPARDSARGDVLVFPVTSAPKPPVQILAKADAVCGGGVSELLRAATLGDECGRIIHSATGGKHRRLIVVSLGPSAGLTAERIRATAVKAAHWLANENVKRASLWIDGLIKTGIERPVSEWAGGMVQGGFRFEPHKQADRQRSDKIDVSLLTSNKAYLAGKMPRIREATALAEAVNYARTLAHQPANVIQPTSLAAEARRMARRFKLGCKILGPAELKRLKMNGLIAVGRGAEHQPCMIRLEYKGAPSKRGHVVLIGKAVTFDTGGYSLKPKEGLEGLKYDKCGGTTVLGIMRAAAALKLKCNLTALIPAAENAVSDRAYRPGDIITMMSGKTVEIISTDAEGRMILADALTYAQKYCKPTVMMNFATLTGGVIIALGRVAAGLMSNDETLANDLEESGRHTHERLWRMPLWDDYRELIRGYDSDIRNSAGKREAHCIVGGIFLKEFVDDDVPWAHIDLAGTSVDEATKSATGYGVRLIVDYLRRRAGA